MPQVLQRKGWVKTPVKLYTATADTLLSDVQKLKVITWWRSVPVMLAWPLSLPYAKAESSLTYDSDPLRNVL